MVTRIINYRNVLAPHRFSSPYFSTKLFQYQARTQLRQRHDERLLQ